MAVTTTRRTDTTVTLGTTYTYTVIAIDTSANFSAISQAVTYAYQGRRRRRSGRHRRRDHLAGSARRGVGEQLARCCRPRLAADNADFTTQGYRTILVKPGTYAGPFVTATVTV